MTAYLGDDLPVRMEELFDRLWPLNRSITGPGLRESLDLVAEVMPHERLRFATGERVFDWTVPREWSVRDAYIITPDGRRIADVKENNLHVVGYSVPVNATMPLTDLRLHLHTLPSQPNAIPYVTSYYSDQWGFCIPHSLYDSLEDGDYEVRIDSVLEDGFLETGEAVLPGESGDEVLFSSYLCHPSMANNELSGPIVLAFLYEALARFPNRRFTYRFAMNVETIGTICFLSRRGEHLAEHLRAGFVLTCIGDEAPFTLKTSRDGNTLADRAARLVLRDRGEGREVAFDASSGSEERQYCSPGFNLPVASMSRSLYGTYPEYHTSLDDKSFVSFTAMAESLECLLQIVHALETNQVWKNTVMFGEPQLGTRNLYPNRSADMLPSGVFRDIKWLLNLADGTRDLLAVAERSGKTVTGLAEAAELLAVAGLIAPAGGHERTRGRDRDGPQLA